MKVLTVVGARPNFMKAIPVVTELRRRAGFDPVLVHTGQHYDDPMSQSILEDLGAEAPDHNLAVGSGSHAAQTARVMEGLEPVLLEERPDLVLVPGDVNGTMAAALVAAKVGIPVGHIEAGLRSFDWTMPEEINRVVTDRVSNLLFVHSQDAIENLQAEGVCSERIHHVGNTMIDSLALVRPRLRELRVLERMALRKCDYLLVTLHRPALVDGPLLDGAMSALARVAQEMPVVFPCHPRTRKRLETLKRTNVAGVRLLEPMGYLEFLALLESSAGVLTDSGGVQEESTFLGVPCFTMRDNTERPVTLSEGTNMLLGLRPDGIKDIPELIHRTRGRETKVPAGWDGRAAERVVDVLEATR